MLCLTTKYSMQAECFTNRRDWRDPNSEDRIDLAPSLQSWAAVKLVMRDRFSFLIKIINYFTYAKLFAPCGCFNTEVSTCVADSSLIVQLYVKRYQIFFPFTIFERITRKAHCLNSDPVNAILDMTNLGET